MSSSNGQQHGCKASDPVVAMRLHRLQSGIDRAYAAAEVLSKEFPELFFSVHPGVDLDRVAENLAEKYVHAEVMIDFFPLMDLHDDDDSDGSDEGEEEKPREEQPWHYRDWFYRCNTGMTQYQMERRVRSLAQELMGLVTAKS
jgi:hypothetical protein